MPTTRTDWPWTPRRPRKLRFFGLAGWVIDRFVTTRTPAVRPAVRGNPAAREVGARCAWCIVAAANVARVLAARRRGSRRTRSARPARRGVRAGGDRRVADRLRRAELGARRGQPRRSPHSVGSKREGRRSGNAAGRGVGMPSRPTGAPEMRFRDVRFAYRRRGQTGARRVRSDDPGGYVARHRRPERRGQDDPGEAAVPAVRPARRARIEVDGAPLTDLDLDAWRRRVTAVFQDFVRFELSLRTNVAPARRRRDDVIRGRARRCRRRPIWPTATSTRSCRRPTRAAPTSRAASGSGSRWPGRCAPYARARASCCSTNRPRSSTCAARRRSSSGCSPRRATCTTILISHRFSTVRLADRIAVIEGGRLIELGTPRRADGVGGRYRTMFELQASTVHRGRRARPGGRPMSHSEVALRSKGRTCRPRCRRCGARSGSATGPNRGCWRSRSVWRC